MSELRERMAGAIYGGGWGNAHPDDRDYWLTVADNVIGELGLRRESTRQIGPTAAHRYITDWKADDE